MRRIASSKTALGLGIAVLAGLVGTTVLAMATLGTTTQFRDQVGDRVRSDGYAVPDADYVNGLDCVGGTRDTKSGATALRTASHTVCPDSFWLANPAVRTIAVDFSHPVGSFPSTCAEGELNACGNNTIDDVRIHTADAFSSRALTNGTRVEIYLSFNPHLNNTEFYLEYEQPLSVTGGATSRIITAQATAIAELYRATKVKNKYVLTSIGRYYMPMQMVITTP
jgi:hypothetical protein